jgi:hypothetical protein
MIVFEKVGGLTAAAVRPLIFALSVVEAFSERFFNDFYVKNPFTGSELKNKYSPTFL